jgi:hypothetical protein
LTGAFGAASTSSLTADSDSVQPLQTASATAVSAAAASAPPVADPSPASPNVAQLIAVVKKSQAAVIAGQQAVDSAQADIDAAQEVVAADVVNNTSLRDGQRAACGSPPSDGTQTDPCVAAMAVTRRPLPRRPVAPGGYLPFAAAGSTTAHVTDSSRGAGTRAVQIRVGSSLGGTAQGGVRRSSRGRGVIARIARRSSRDGSQHG